MFEGVGLYVLVFVVVSLSIYMAVSLSIRSGASEMHDQLEKILDRNLELHKEFLEKIDTITKVDRPQAKQELSQALEQHTQACATENQELIESARATVKLMEERLAFWDSLLSQYENLALSHLDSMAKVKKILGQT